MEFLRSMILTFVIILGLVSLICLIGLIGQLIVSLWGEFGIGIASTIICFLGLSGLVHFLRHF